MVFVKLSSLQNDFTNFVNTGKASYTIIGKVVIASIDAILNTGLNNCGLPIPKNNFFALLRDSNNGKYARLWVRSDNGYITDYGGENFVDGHSYEGTFIYLIK